MELRSEVGYVNPAEDLVQFDLVVFWFDFKALNL